MSKLCPFWILAVLIPSDSGVSICELPTAENENRSNWSSLADCKESYCQMWNPQTQDCGLKQLPAVPQLQEGSDLPDIDTLPRPSITIPEKDWPHQNNAKTKPNFHMVDSTPPPSEPE